MADRSEKPPFKTVTQEGQAEGLEYEGSSEPLRLAIKFQKDLAFRNEVTEKYRDMLKEIPDPRQRSKTIDKLVTNERKRQEESRQEEFTRWYQGKLDSGEQVSGDPQQRFEQFLKERGAAV